MNGTSELRAAPGAQAYRQAASDVASALSVDPDTGLGGSEPAKRLEIHGRNELARAAPMAGWKKFLSQFTDVLVALLLVAAAVSTALWWVERDSPLPYEALAIAAVVLINALMGFVQEARAESALAALRAMSANVARVVRNGERCSIPAAEVVPGDILLIEEGDSIPADGRLIESVSLQIAEAALTGESLPVPKDTEPIAQEVALGDRHNMVFSGTAATYGHGKAVVTATGMATEMGAIAEMVEAVETESTPLQVELGRVGRLLGAVVIAIAAVMVTTLVLVGQVRGWSALAEVLIFGVALAVAAVPEGLPAVVTAVLALGVQRMARRNAIVRHLAAVETLGSASVIASDKTGTLTKNEMTVRTVLTASGRADFTGTGYSPDGTLELHGECAAGAAHREELRRALTVADRANNSALLEEAGRWSVAGDPTEGALLVAARKAGLDSEQLGERFKRIAEVPFSSERRLMSTVHSDRKGEKHLLVFTKGAPDVLLARCTREQVGFESRPLSAPRRAEILRANDQLADEALRTLAVAARELPGEAAGDAAHDERVEQDLVFLGLIGMLDPPREDALAAIARARRAGVRPIMITGDHPRTAAIIAAELGIAAPGENALTGAALAKLSDDDLLRAVGQTSVYARVDPGHKLRIVTALQRAGQTVSMTGDGVNDAPALRAADIGVSMGITGTDVSKQAADVVLTDDNFATIVAAVEEGRAIYANIRKFLRYLLSSNIGEVMTMFFGVLLGGLIGLDAGAQGAVVLPLMATQILWINLVTDGAPALALGVEPPDPDGMERPPRPRGERIITGRMWRGIAAVGLVMAGGTLAVLDASLPGGLIEGSGSLRYGQTMAFTTLVLFQLFNVLNARSDRRSAFPDLIHNPWLWGAIGLSVLMHLAVVYTPFLQAAFSTVPLSAADWLVCTAVASSVLWVCELSKVLMRLREAREAKSVGDLEDRG
jgi:Ca2+-transporting ATPase